MTRVLDVLFSLIALLVLSPLLIPIAVLLRLTGEGEVLFRQQRVGQDGSMFALLKFATMLKNSPAMGSGTITLQEDPRVLPVGRFLRASKLNELPQLINVLWGEMSLIGPRPQTERCFAAFPAAAQAMLVTVRPGLSGIGSIVFRDEARLLSDADQADQLYDQLIMPYKGQLEQWFVEHQGLKTYFLLLFLTLWVVMRPNSSMHYRVFKNLPLPPDALKPLLAY